MEGAGTSHSILFSQNAEKCCSLLLSSWFPIYSGKHEETYTVNKFRFLFLFCSILFHGLIFRVYVEELKTKRKINSLTWTGNGKVKVSESVITFTGTAWTFALLVKLLNLYIKKHLLHIFNCFTYIFNWVLPYIYIYIKIANNCELFHFLRDRRKLLLVMEGAHIWCCFSDKICLKN